MSPYSHRINLCYLIQYDFRQCSNQIVCNVATAAVFIKQLYSTLYNQLVCYKQSQISKSHCVTSPASAIQYSVADISYIFCLAFL